MLFDETFSFNEPEAARYFASAMKEGDVKCRINETLSNNPRDIVTGKMDDINRWLLAIADDSGDLKESILLLREKNVMLKDGIDNYLKDKSKGDFLYTYDELEEDIIRANERLKEEIEKSDPDNPDNIFGLLPELLENSPFTMAHRLLEDQDILEECEDGFSLKDDITGEDINFQVPAIDLRFCEGPEFSGLKLVTIFDPVIKYEVTVNILDIIHLDMEELNILLFGCGINHDDAARIGSNYIFKKTITTLILKGVDENSGISAEELSFYIIDKWNSLDLIKDAESKLELREEIIPAFISELKKAGIIAGNTDSLRIPSAKSRKKKRRH